MKCVLTCLLSLTATVCFAEKNAEITPALAKPGKVVLDEKFDGPKLSAGWAGVKGDWKPVEGVLIGKELKSDKHAAVLNYKHSNKNSIVRFSFKLDAKTKGFHFSLNHKGGYLFRALVSETGMIVRTDHSKKDKSIKSEVIGKAKGKFEQGKWYTMQVEMVGEKVVIQTDNGVKVSGSNKRLDTDKPGYRFILRNETLSLDDVKVWAAK